MLLVCEKEIIVRLEHLQLIQYSTIKYINLKINIKHITLFNVNYNVRTK